MDNKEFLAHLKEINACKEAIQWVGEKTMQEVFDTCERGDWMLWWFRKEIGKDGWPRLQELTLAKVKCARLVQHLMKDPRSIGALDVAERFGNGMATMEEMNAAAADGAVAAAYAYAAAAADYAAAAAAAAAAGAVAADGDYAAAAAAAGAVAARKETLKECADICREFLFLPVKQN